MLNKKDNKEICGYCFYPYKKGKLVKCSNCGKKFCKNCLVDVGNRNFMCISCMINCLRNNTEILLFSGKISKKRNIKIPLNNLYDKGDLDNGK